MSIRQNPLFFCTRWAVATVATVVLSGLGTTALAEEPTKLTLNQVLEAARLNPNVAYTRQAAEAARADILAADHAPIPVFSLKAGSMYLDGGINKDSYVGSAPYRDKNIDTGAGLDWTWERGGKRRHRTESAQRQANASLADLQDTLVMQQTMAAAAYFDLLAAQTRNHEMTKLSQSAETLAKTAAARLKAGDVSAQESMRIEIEAQRAMADGHSALLDQQRAALQLNQLTRITLDADHQYVEPDWPTLPKSPLPQKVSDDWVAQRADVVAAQERVAAARAAVDFALAQKRADITLGSSVDHDPRVSRRSVEVRLSMPLQWNYDYEGEIGRAQAQLAQAEAQLVQTETNARADLQRMLDEYRAATQREALYSENIVPRARRVAQQAELAYTKGALSLTDLLDARRTLRSTLIEAAFTRADYAKAQTAWQLRTEAQSTTR
jgi:cobalt-zinc-cadmium efflux system outer membrane protein